MKPCDSGQHCMMEIKKAPPPYRAIDDLHRTVVACDGDEQRKEGKTILEELTTLKYEVQHNRHMTFLVDDGQPDIEGYTKELEALGHPKWLDVPWLYAECYLYRRMSTFFTPSQYWKSYDVFARQKMSTFKSSRPAILELATKKRRESAVHRDDGNLPLGNATDLSLLTSLTYEDLQKLQGSEARKQSEKNILVNDLPAVYKVLKDAQKNGKQDRRVDIVLDNAGFELFVDLILAGYLLSADLATQVVLHPKSIPWFVSDVIPADFAELLNTLANPHAFDSTPYDDSEHSATSSPLSEAENAALSFLFPHWSGLHQEGRLTIRPNRFWTHGGSYWRLPTSAPTLYTDLQASELVIFKGDLNYRKLTGDAMWDPTTPFQTAIGPLASNLRTLALRTCKADVVVGLPQGVDERLRGEYGGDPQCRKWAWSGTWAVVQFCDGKDGGR
ncbi:damage-control phosphatase [Physcia stellaris]|nr:damage-control phosphatase [Physcia stellaris]